MHLFKVRHVGTAEEEQTSFGGVIGALREDWAKLGESGTKIAIKTSKEEKVE